MASDTHAPETTGPPASPDPERDLIWLLLDGLRLRRGAPTLAEVAGDMEGLDQATLQGLRNFSLDYFADIASHAVVAALVVGLGPPAAVRQGFADMFGAVCYEREVARRAWASKMGGLHVDIGR